MASSPSQSLLDLLNLLKNPNPSTSTEPVLILTPELFEELRDLVSTSDDPELTELLLTTQRKLLSFQNDHNALVGDHQDDENSHRKRTRGKELPQNEAVDTSLVVVSHTDENALPKRRRGKLPPKELVRASSLSPEDSFKSRMLIRTIRIAYDSLRCYYYLQKPQKDESDKQVNRYAMNAYAEMKKHPMLDFLKPHLRVTGNIPGVQIGDVFFYRTELCLLGLHSQTQAGINYAPAGYTDNNEPIALSVVAWGDQNEDQPENGILIYTGCGKGQNENKILSDQTLERGNLALERSYNYNIEIRVIRGINHYNSPSRALYVYDGLYKVLNYNIDDKSGRNIYKFKLARIANQKESGVKLINFAKELKAKLKQGILPAGYKTRDISLGSEQIIIPFYNDIDNDNFPMHQEYVKSPKYPSMSLKSKSLQKGCDCKNACSDNCACRERNSNTFAYYKYHKKCKSVLLQGRPVIYECGDTCQCPIGCPNRVTQKGIKYQLEVFRCLETYWGVRSLDPIQAGTFICQFSGDIILKNNNIINNNNDNYNSLGLIDPMSFPERWREWGYLGDILPNYKMTESPLVSEDPEYVLDVSRRANVSSYLSHSRSPNCFVQFVLYGHDCARFPRLMVFALENIHPFTPLCLDFGY